MTNVFTDEELRHDRLRAFSNGVVFAMIVTAAAALLYFWLHRPASAPAPIGAPEIVRQTPNVTVARIPTLRYGNHVSCTVIIDQKLNAWSITC